MPSDLTRDQFTFFGSFYKAIQRIKKKADRCEAYDAICAYALCGIEPDLDSLPDAAAIAFELTKPNLDASRKKASAGKIGGSKTEANDKQNGNKREANRKRGETASEKENEKESEIESEIEKENESYISTEPENPARVPFIVFPLNDGSEHQIFDDDIHEWEELYPAVDVHQELRNMRGWLLSNPTKRKTKNGVDRFITTWLEKQQNSGGGVNRGKPAERPKHDGDNLPGILNL